MDTIFEQIAQNIRQSEDELSGLTIEAVIEFKDEITDLNVSQIERGLGYDGKILGEYESDRYSKLKQDMGSLAPYGVYDFKFSGEFLDDTTVEEHPSGQGQLIFLSYDEKSSKLEELSNDRVFGLTDESIGQLKDIGIIESLQEKINERITRS